MNHLQLGEFPELPSTEPEIIPELSITGISMTVTNSGFAHVVGTSLILDGDGNPVERRIVLRFSIHASFVEAFKAWSMRDTERNDANRETSRRNNH